jgi:hypothetical protein
MSLSNRTNVTTFQREAGTLYYLCLRVGPKRIWRRRRDSTCRGMTDRMGWHSLARYTTNTVNKGFAIHPQNPSILAKSN